MIHAQQGAVRSVSLHSLFHISYSQKVFWFVLLFAVAILESFA